MLGIRGGLAVAAGLSMLLRAPPALADAVPDPVPVSPPYNSDPSCTVDEEQTDGLECIRCEIEHTEYSSDPDSCLRENVPWGYDLACGAGWAEIWCRDANVVHEYDPDALGEEGCSVVLGRTPALPAVAALAVAVLALGLVARRRSRG